MVFLVIITSLNTYSFCARKPTCVSICTASSKTSSIGDRYYFSESIRSLRKKRGEQRPLQQPKAIVSPPKFGPDDQSSSTSSSDESDLKMPNTERASSFTVIRRDLSRKRSDVERTAKVGEMNNVANEFSGTGPARVRWAEMPEVVRRNLTTGLTKEQRSLQEVFLFFLLLT